MSSKISSQQHQLKSLLSFRITMLKATSGFVYIVEGTGTYSPYWLLKAKFVPASRDEYLTIINPISMQYTEKLCHSILNLDSICSLLSTSFFFIYMFMGVEKLSLTHWGCDKMANIPHTTFSNAFSQMNLLIKFHCDLFLELPIENKQHWLR